MSRIRSDSTLRAERARFPSLRGKRVFITGGASGIGACLVSAFAHEQACVAFVDIDGGSAVALAASLGAIRAAAAAIGDFHVLVNNVASDDRHTVAEVTPEYWDDRMAINERAAFFAIQAVLPGMQTMGGGSIVNIGSTGWQAKAGGYPVY